nr:wall-associated kinase family protein [Tanacetum cinerariifolium]
MDNKTNQSNPPTPEKPQIPLISSYLIVEEPAEEHDIVEEPAKGGLTENELHQLALDEEALIKVLEEEAQAEKKRARAEKEREEEMKKEEAHNELFNQYNTNSKFGTIMHDSGCPASIAAPVYAKPGCDDMCGNVRIPFPFGIGANCSVNGWYVVNCNSSIPYLSALDNLEVLSVDLGNQTVTVNMQKISNCRCGNAVMMGDHGNVLTACSTTCSNVDTTCISVHRNNKCVGINCCETTIPHYLKSYSMNLTSLERPVGGNGTCGSAFLVDENSYIEGSRLSHQSSAAEGSSYVQTSLLWTISDLEHLQVTCCDKNNPRGYGRIVDMGNGTLVNTWKCHYYESSAGNPYLIDGCNDYRSVSEECSRCEDRGGYCHYDTTYDVDDLIYNNKFTCGFYRVYSYEEIRSSKSSLGVILVSEKPFQKSRTNGFNLLAYFPQKKNLERIK